MSQRMLVEVLSRSNHTNTILRSVFNDVTRKSIILIALSLVSLMLSTMSGSSIIWNYLFIVVVSYQGSNYVGISNINSMLSLVSAIRISHHFYHVNILWIRYVDCLCVMLMLDVGFHILLIGLVILIAFNEIISTLLSVVHLLLKNHSNDDLNQDYMRVSSLLMYHIF